MEAAKLTKVEDSISKGINALPSAGENSGWVAKGTIGPGPQPTPAINSGKTLAFPAVTHDVVEPGMGRLYKRDADATLSAKGSGDAFHAPNETK